MGFEIHPVTKICAYTISSIALNILSNSFFILKFLDSPYFQKEFPTLGQDGEFMDSEKGGVEGGDRNANRQAMDPRMMSMFN